MDFLLFAVLVDSSCQCKDFLYLLLNCNSRLNVFRNFQNCMGIWWLSIRCNNSFVVVGGSYCNNCKVLRIVGSKDMVVMLYSHCKGIGDKLDYSDSFLLLRRRTCCKKNITVHHFVFTSPNYTYMLTKLTVSIWYLL